MSRGQAAKHFMSYRPLRRRIDRHLPMLTEAGFRLMNGRDAGWFGDGSYVLGNRTQLLRITRLRGEEFVEVAFTQSPADEDWFDLAEIMVAHDAVTFEEVMNARAIPHDLDFKIDAYLKLYSTIDQALAHDRVELEQRLNRVRRRAMEYARDRAG